MKLISDCFYWCCWGGLNSRPHPYQGADLPANRQKTVNYRKATANICKNGARTLRKVSAIALGVTPFWILVTANATPMPIKANIVNLTMETVASALEFCADHNMDCPAICSKADNETRVVWCEAEGLCCNEIQTSGGDDE